MRSVSTLHQPWALVSIMHIMMEIPNGDAYISLQLTLDDHKCILLNHCQELHSPLQHPPLSPRPHQIPSRCSRCHCRYCHTPHGPRTAPVAVSKRASQKLCAKHYIYWMQQQYQEQPTSNLLSLASHSRRQAMPCCQCCHCMQQRDGPLESWMPSHHNTSS